MIIFLDEKAIWLKRILLKSNLTALLEKLAAIRSNMS